MSLFRKPQEKKGSAVRADAQSGKKALAQERRGFRLPIFGKKKESSVEKKQEEETSAESEKSPIQTPARERFGGASAVILQPRITEKATDLSTDNNTYVFDVHPAATKNQIAAGVKELYGVTPDKVRVINLRRKAVRGRRGERGRKGGGRKAYVYLKKGDTIEFV